MIIKPSQPTWGNKRNMAKETRKPKIMCFEGSMLVLIRINYSLYV